MPKAITPTRASIVFPVCAKTAANPNDMAEFAQLNGCNRPPGVPSSPSLLCFPTNEAEPAEAASAPIFLPECAFLARLRPELACERARRRSFFLV